MSTAHELQLSKLKVLLLMLQMKNHRHPMMIFMCPPAAKAQGGQHPQPLSRRAVLQRGCHAGGGVARL